MSLTQVRPFRPFGNNNTQSIATVSAVNQVITLPNVQAFRSVRVANLSGNTIFIEFGATSGVAASASNSIALPSGITEVYTIGNDIGYIGVISTGAGGAVYFTIGEGV